MLHCESPLEEEAVLRFEACPSVETIVAQPRTIQYFCADGVQRRATPDFELGLQDGRTVLVEVKHSDQLSRPDVAERLAAVRRACTELGYPYYVITDRWIRIQPLLENLRVLTRWRSTASPEPSDPLVDWVMADLPLPLFVAAQRLGGTANTAAYVLSGRLHLNLLSPISRDALVLPSSHRASGIALELPWRTSEGRRHWEQLHD